MRCSSRRSRATDGFAPRPGVPTILTTVEPRSHQEAGVSAFPGAQERVQRLVEALLAS
jgi:hypothetical protein